MQECVQSQNLYAFPHNSRVEVAQSICTLQVVVWQDLQELKILIREKMIK
ncbi:hypothetical protein X975_25801, partial [Stegodyphus mimosarum]